jgi:catechol 2,3-dioxygenase-like lactoylglutathione lyase family enzyme
VRIEQAAPALLTSDLERTAAWYRDALGWEFELYGESVGIATRDGQRITYVLDYTLCDQPRGMREFGVQDPDGRDIGFGAPSP